MSSTNHIRLLALLLLLLAAAAAFAVARGGDETSTPPGAQRARTLGRSPLSTQRVFRGVTPHRDVIQRRAVGLNERLTRLAGDRYGSMWFDGAQGRLKVGIVGARRGDALTRRVEAVVAARGLRRDADVVAVRSSVGELFKAQRALDRRLMGLLAAGRVSSGIDTSINSVVVQMSSTISYAGAARVRAAVDEAAPVAVVVRPVLARSLTLQWR